MSPRSSWTSRLLLKTLPPDFRRRYGDEVAHHFSARTRELHARRGWLAVLGFWFRGGLDLVRTAAAERKEEREMKKRAAHAGRGRGDLVTDIRFALRTLRRSPGFTLVALLTLALGIGATTAMFSILNAAMGRALPFPEPERLILGRATFSGNVNPTVSFPDYMDYRDQAESLETFAAFMGGAAFVTVTGADEPQQAQATMVTANFFATLGVNPVLGRTFTLDEQPAEGSGEVVISHAFWQQWFGGDPEVIGKALIVEGGVQTVMGVMPAGFRFYTDADLWVPPWPGNSDPITRRYHNWLLVGRLAPGVTLDGARAEVDVISSQLQEAYPDSNTNKALQLDNLHTALMERYRQSLFLLVGAIVLVLLIACSNVAGLLMARGSTRSGEMAIRASLGAGRGRLTRQLLVECLILALVAGTLGVLLAVWVQDLLLGLVSMDQMGIGPVGLDSTMLGIALVVSLGTVLLFGVFPSFAASRANPGEELKEGARTFASRGGMRFRNALVVLQVGLSLVLLVGSGLLLKSFARLSEVDPGYRVENVLIARVTLPDGKYPDAERRTQFFSELKEGIEALPGVQSVGVVSHIPILNPWGNVAIWAPERPPEANTRAPWADRRLILPGYLETMEMPLLEGRTFDERDGAGSQPVIILTRRTVELVFPDEPALGRQVAVDVGGDEPGYFEVVGIVEDAQINSLSGSRRPAMYFPYAQMSSGNMGLAIATAVPPHSLSRPIQERLWEMDRDIVLSEPRPLEEVVSSSIGSLRAVSGVLGVFAGVAMALAALGLYGVLAFLVNKRIREIGIRVALGATSGRVMGLVLSRGMALVGAGVALGIVGAVVGSRFLESILFQTSARDPWTFVGVTLLFLVVALGACVLPGWRAMKVNPVEAFRTE